MFGGADGQLVQDALIIAALAAAAGMGLVFGIRRIRNYKPATPATKPGKSDLEERVKVLERIATDRSIGLREEIDALSSKKETA